MPFPNSWARVLLAAGLLLAALVAAPTTDHARFEQPMTIFGKFDDRTVMLTATHRSGGAIESLVWGGMEFIDASDHGRHLQSAMSYDGLGECHNPTEAGASRDGAPPTVSSSRLDRWSVAGNVLRTDAHMAYWLRRGQHSAECRHAINGGDPSPLSSTRFTKTVRFLPGFGNVLEHTVTFHLPRAHRLALFEALTAYMPARFGTFYRFNPASQAMEPLSDGPGEQEMPVVLATSDASHALGLFAPKAAGADLTGPGFGRWRFEGAGVTKSNVAFRQRMAKAGPHRFVVYTVFGTLEDVRATLGRLHGTRPGGVAGDGVLPQTDAMAPAPTTGKDEG